ncbi:MAG: DUF1456 family protein [Gammaproteobacteria bacterium]|nr:DUF1456 family protein [Gammaproteobacteria bacterium]
MINNDVLRRVRYTFDYSDTQMMELFAHADCEVSREHVCSWLKQEDDPGYEEMMDRLLATFLNGLINALRGRRAGDQPVPEDRLSNNMILMKLRIALDLQSEDVLSLLDSVGLTFSKHELSALFRKPGHKHYRVCEDQVLRNFLKALQLHFREGASSDSPEH